MCEFLLIRRFVLSLLVSATLYVKLLWLQECVKTKAIQSVLAVRNVSEEEARAAVNRVFNRCYADLEPIGRRIRRNSRDMYKAYMEAPYYGYDY